ncbi:MAG: hypothetical protein HY896_13405 [Deltaproteobacteria bacterium]|nr:hypothetical protein [Deltaproteobacteria bacterium]
MDPSDRKNLLKILLATNLLLLAMYLVTNVIFQSPSWRVKHLFDLDQEYNIPTWFSTMQLFLVFLISFACARGAESKALRRGYRLLAAVFLFFSLDETAEIHESVGRTLGLLLRRHGLIDLRGIWILVYLLAALLLVLLFRKEIVVFLEIPEGRNLFVAGAAVFVLGGMASEAIGIYMPQLPKMKQMEIFFEEGLEMLGETLMLFGLSMRLKPFRRSGVPELIPPAG